MKPFQLLRTLAALSLALGAAPALAQSAEPPRFDLQRLHLDPAARGSLLVGNGEVAPQGEFRLAVGFTGEHHPLVVGPSGSFTGAGMPFQRTSGAVVDDRLTVNVGVGYAIWRRLELSLDLPFVGWQRSQLSAAVAAPNSAGIATPRVGARYGVLVQDDEAGMPLSLAVGTDVRAPWGSASALAGQDSTGIGARLELGRRFDGWLVAAHGEALVRTAKIDNAPERSLGNEIAGGFAVSTTGKMRVELSARAFMDLENRRKGIEPAAGARLSLGRYELFALGGFGLGHLPGTPALFAVGGIAFTGRVGAPPPASVPHLPPRFADVPLPPPPVAPPALAAAATPRPERCAEGQPHAPGECPLLDDDGDRVPNGLDACPLVSGLAELHGCAPADRDGDGLADHLDRCPRTRGPGDHHGCPPPRKARLRGPKIEISEAIHFGYASAKLRARSLAVLDDVAAVIRATPSIQVVTVEGHTDDSADAETNRKLSIRRAKAVRAYLVSKGIAAERLVARGYGPDRPITSNATRAGRERNRRVDFFATIRPAAPASAAAPAAPASTAVAAAPPKPVR